MANTVKGVRMNPRHELAEFIDDHTPKLTLVPFCASLLNLLRPTG